MAKINIEASILDEIPGLSKSALYSYCSKKKIPHSEIGRKLRFKRRELMKWFDDISQTGLYTQ